MKRAWGLGGVAAAAAMLLGSGTASAHALSCEKTVNSETETSYTIPSYPAEITWYLTVKNAHLTLPSDVQGLQDDLLTQEFGFIFDPAAGYTLPLGGSQAYSDTETITDEAMCMRIAASDGKVDDVIENVFIVTWDSGSAQCSATVKCKHEQQEEGGATRTMGFFKTHRVALQSCLDEGAIDLGPGFELIDTIEEALGLLWAKPARYEDNTKRSELDRARFQLARQTLVAICNERLFSTSSGGLVEDALAALEGTDCADLHDLNSQVDAFNNSGDNEPFPEGFDKGPSTPKANSDLADGNDPSIKTSDSCSN